MGRIVDEHCVPKYNDKLAIPAFVVIPSRTIHYPTPLKPHVESRLYQWSIFHFLPNLNRLAAKQGDLRSWGDR